MKCIDVATETSYNPPLQHVCSYSDYEFVFFAGLVIAGGAFVYSRKAVAKIILHKGGKSVYIETFGLLGLGKKHIVNLDEVRFLQVVRVHKGIYIIFANVD